MFRADLRRCFFKKWAKEEGEEEVKKKERNEGRNYRRRLAVRIHSTQYMVHSTVL